jgi:L-arabinose isomerase
MKYENYANIANRVPLNCRIGVFPIGLEKYWNQFPGLLDELNEHVGNFVSQLKENPDIEVVLTPMVDSAEKAIEVGRQLQEANCDIIFCYLATYAPSATVVPVAQITGRPMVLICLQPDSCLDYERATMFRQLVNDNCTSLPEIANGLIRTRQKQAGIVVGKLYNDERARQKVNDWVRVARVIHSLRGSVIGQMGHTYEGMLDMHTDPTMAAGAFGCHVRMLETDDLLVEVKAAQPEEVEQKVQEIQEFFRFPGAGTDPHAGPVTQDQLEYSASVSVGLDNLIRKYGLTGLCYYYIGGEGTETRNLIPGMIVGNSLLTGRGIPVAGECDLKTCIAMLIMDRLGAGGSFCEFHPMDLDDDFVLVGHDGPAHVAIAEGKPILRGLSLLHGKEGQGASVEFGVKSGPITICGLTSDGNGRFKMVVAEGQSIEGLVPATGNTNTRGKFAPDTETFIENWSMEGPTHHFAAGIGHHAQVLKKVASVLDIDFVQVA